MLIREMLDPKSLRDREVPPVSPTELAQETTP